MGNDRPLLLSIREVRLSRDPSSGGMLLDNELYDRSNLSSEEHSANSEGIDFEIKL